MSAVFCLRNSFAQLKKNDMVVVKLNIRKCWKNTSSKQQKNTKDVFKAICLAASWFGVKEGN